MYQRAAPWVVGGLRVVKPVVEQIGWKRMKSMENLAMEYGTCWYVGEETGWCTLGWIQV